MNKRHSAMLERFEADRRKLVTLGSFYYESILRDKGLIDDSKPEVHGTVEFAIWEIMILGRLCDVKPSDLERSVDKVESQTWETVESSLDLSQSKDYDRILGTWRPHLPGIYTRAKAEVIGFCVFLSGKEDFYPWSADLLAKLGIKERHAIRRYVYEIFAEIRRRSASKKEAPEAPNVLVINSSMEPPGMRSHYRSIVLTMLVVAAAMLVWPPWKVGTGGRAIGYHLFFRSNPAGYASAYLDWS